MERECTWFLKDCCLKYATKNIFLLISNNLMIAATEMDLKGATQGNVKNSVSVSVNCWISADFLWEYDNVNDGTYIAWKSFSWNCK